MRLALIIDDYLPKSTRVGAKMFHELALELQAQGHHVTIITPDINQSASFVQDEVDGTRIWRFRSGPIKDIGKVKRLINESLLSFRAWRAINHKVSETTFDGVVYYSPSIFFGGLVKEIKRRCKCASYLVLRDIFPQWAIDAGMIRQGSIIDKYLQHFEHRSYSEADNVGLMSEKNLEVFNRANAGRYPAGILRNWASSLPYVNNVDTASFRETLGLQGKVIFFYGGNIGHAQDMANLVRLAKGMRQYNDAHFLFVGQGDEVVLINKLATDWKLSNFTYLPAVDQNEFKRLLAEVDVGLFSLSAKHTAHNFPGKILGYMAQSLPILGSVNAGNDLMELVNTKQAGFIFVNGYDEAFLNAAEELYRSEATRKQLGKNSYQLLVNEFSVSSAAGIIVNALQSSNLARK